MNFISKLGTNHDHGALIARHCRVDAISRYLSVVDEIEADSGRRRRIDSLVSITASIRGITPHISPTIPGHSGVGIIILKKKFFASWSQKICALCCGLDEENSKRRSLRGINSNLIPEACESSQYIVNS